MTYPVMLFRDNASSTLASPITSGATSVTLTSGGGANFPVISGNQFFILTFISAADNLVTEIVNVTATSGDTFTMVRAQEGTTALSWSAGDIVQMGPTAGTMANMQQTVQAQAGAFKYAIDTGTVNAYAVALTPAVTTRIPGLEINILANTSNTGASTLNLGAGSISLVNPNGSSLGAGAIIAGGPFTALDTGSGPYYLTSASQESQSSSGQATTGDEKFRSTAESISGWVVANATTIGNASSNATQLADPTTINLFEWHWNNFSNTQCPVFTSAGSPTTRGVNAATDYAANKAIQVLDKRGKGQLGMDTMGGSATTLLTGVPVTSGNATTPGSILGQNLHTLSAGEIPTINSANGSQSISVNAPGTGKVPYVPSTDNISAVTLQTAGGGGEVVPYNAGSSSSWLSAQTFSANNSITVASTNTGGGAHNTVHLSMVGTYYLKL